MSIRIEPACRRLLAHSTGSTTTHQGSGYTITTHYRTYPFIVRRPGSGTTTTAVACGTCDAAVGVRVHSVEEATRRRRRIALGTVLLLVVLLVAAIKLARLDAWPPVGAIAFVGGFGAYRLYRAWQRYDGIRALERRHKILPPTDAAG
ncbi:hypothetical protein [Streptomyces shenzhenensis]|uniref:hypothetical protein n=1 Tax=Streptomyces shenzhenensis TaxID=943815 RepID=UPI001F287BB5|nr:hypothetical protein [Streptomyces shenzhenensis]